VLGLVKSKRWRELLLFFLMLSHSKDLFGPNLSHIVSLAVDKDFKEETAWLGNCSITQILIKINDKDSEVERIALVF
jgi:hypothetical protein